MAGLCSDNIPTNHKNIDKIRLKIKRKPLPLSSCSDNIDKPQSATILIEICKESLVGLIQSQLFLGIKTRSLSITAVELGKFLLPFKAKVHNLHWTMSYKFATWNFCQVLVCS